MIELNKDENVFYPMPYVEGEAHLLVITNQRVVHFGDEGKQELPAKSIQFIGRTSGRPFVTLAIIMIFLALASVGVGIYWVITSGLLSHAAQVVPGDDPSQPQANGGGGAGGDNQAAQGDDNSDTDDTADAPPPPEDKTVYKILGVACTLVGLIMLLGGVLLVRVNRHFVIVRGGQQMIQIRCKTPMEQTQILATVGALQTSGKAQAALEAPKPAAKKKEVQVDDKGDPVKALQDLQAARQAGKISDEEFVAKREVLVARVRARK